MADAYFRCRPDAYFKNTSDNHWLNRSMLFSETVTLADSYSRIWHIYRTFTESITLTDTISKKIGKIFTETLHLTDAFSKIVSYYRTFTEKIALTDKVKVAKVNLVNLIKKLIQLMDIGRW